MLIPKEITRDKDASNLEIASFGYYDGITVAGQKGLRFATSFVDVIEGIGYLVCCGDIMIKVDASEYPDIKRREI